MNYKDIKISLSKFKNYQIPEMSIIITNYIIRNPDTYERFLDRRKNIQNLLSHLHLTFDVLKHYNEKDLLKIILDYFDIFTQIEGK